MTRNVTTADRRAHRPGSAPAHRAPPSRGDSANHPGSPGALPSHPS
ncbi:hypothetical protein STRAU_7526 [Streptomyces aurantiacus JA 4570]|uniref:Uncharacterized protein n=1 Tax=Streptomyces aurantiacus JA 4570 TaxID=1286094 RepID=S3ZM79_9ACTN|nr:hypothetical protein STRAU_7526 [Streptomyces aurantiacus JA 4570]